MFKKLYPADQVERYLLIDIIVLLALIYQVVTGPLHIHAKWIFIALYFAAYYVCLWQRDWRLLVASMAGYFLLVMIALQVDNWLMLYGFVFANLLGRANRKVLIGIGMAGIVMMFVLFSWMDEGHVTSVFTSILFPLMTAQLVTPIIVYTRLKAKGLKEKLDIANKQIERYNQEEERNRIARDLHDTLGQTLTMIKMKSELALKLVEQRPEKAKHEMNDILSSSRYALKQMADLVTDMKYVSLEREMERSKDILHKAGIAFDMKAGRLLPDLSQAAETMVALSMREAVTNIIKHSEAASVRLRRVYKGNNIWYK